MKHTSNEYEEWSLRHLDAAVKETSVDKRSLPLQLAQIYATLAVAAANSPKVLYSETYFEKMK